jgi:hypothetical protein
MNISWFNGLNAKTRYVSLRLNEIRKNLAVNLERSPLTHGCGYGPAGDRPTLFAIFPLNFVPFMQYAGSHGRS